MQELDHLKTRLAISESILDSSYDLISHYDDKANPLLTAMSIDMGVVALTAGLVLQRLGGLSFLVRLSTGLMLGFEGVLLVAALWSIKSALQPHVYAVHARSKKTPGLRYFMDVADTFAEDQYATKLLGDSQDARPSEDQIRAFINEMIDSNARDIYSHAHILRLKTKNVARAFTFVAWSTTLVLALTVLVYLLVAFGN